MPRRAAAALLLLMLCLGIRTQAAGGSSSINPADLREWLQYLASDELGGRAVYTEGLGLAAAYIADHLRSWRVTPAGDNGAYLQTVRVRSVKSTSRSSLTVQVGREMRVFKDGEGVTFPKNVGVKRVVTVSRVNFAGYGLDAPGAKYSDFRGHNVSGSAVVFLGLDGPKAIDAGRYRRLLGGRARSAVESAHAVASLGPAPSTHRDHPPGPGGQTAPDFVTSQRLDLPISPAPTGSDELFEFLFSRAPVHYDELKRRATGGEPLPFFHLDDVTLTFTLDNDYQVTRTQTTQNVVGLVEGSDRTLRSSYVAFGAHYDHVGYADAELSADGRRPSAPGRVTAGKEEDRVWNGADDDGSGTVTLMALARAFAEGPRPKRSLVFVWHAGEERGLLGSRFFADYPTVPLDRVVAQLNIDMIGRNRDDKASEANTVYLVGSDRISSDLHQISRDANAALSTPMTLNYEMNDPGDLEQVYYRSDHYSYAAKGIPIIFFTTGLHADYHANTDEVSKIEFPKMVHIAQLIYAIGRRVADLDHAPVRDNKGPRAGTGTR
ncbi:MAG: M28 family peptidase [Vicinamibacterales bacterium]